MHCSPRTSRETSGASGVGPLSSIPPGEAHSTPLKGMIHPPPFRIPLDIQEKLAPPPYSLEQVNGVREEV